MLDVQETSGFQIPTYDAVLGNATLLANGPLILDPPQILNLSSGKQLLLPFMTFTCSGTITRLTFLGWLSESSERFNIARLTSWPYFFLWHRCDDHYDFYHKIAEIGPTDPNQLRVSMMNGNNVMVVITLTTSITVNEGDILGVRQWQGTASATNGITILPLQIQSNDYGQIQAHDEPPSNSLCSPPNLVTMIYQGQPYISVNVTAASTTQWTRCTSGYDQQSLSNLLASRYLYFPGISPVTMSMPFTHDQQCRLLERLIIVAKLNESVSIG